MVLDKSRAFVRNLRISYLKELKPVLVQEQLGAYEVFRLQASSDDFRNLPPLIEHNLELIGKYAQEVVLDEVDEVRIFNSPDQCVLQVLIQIEFDLL